MTVAKRPLHTRHSLVDGKHRRWELYTALELGEVTPAAIAAHEAIDGTRWVCTGVFNTRREAQG